MENSNLMSSFLVNSSLGTEDDLSSLHRPFLVNIFGSLATTLMVLTSIVGNLTVIYVTYENETLRGHIGNIFLVYLAAIDITTAILVMVPSAIAVALDYWPFGEVMCRINSTMVNAGAFASSKIIVAISVDRAYAVNFPFHYSVNMTRKKAVVAGLIALPISVFEAMLIGVTDFVRYDYTEGVCAVDYMKTLHRQHILEVVAVSAVYIPLTIAGISNASIIAVAMKQNNSAQSLFARRNQLNETVNEATENDKFMKKTIRSMMAVVLAFYVAFGPFGLFRVFKVYSEVNFPVLNYLATILIFSSSAINPFIYAIFRKDYRYAFKRHFKQIARRFRHSNRVGLI